MKKRPGAVQDLDPAQCFARCQNSCRVLPRGCAIAIIFCPMLCQVRTASTAVTTPAAPSASSAASWVYLGVRLELSGPLLESVTGKCQYFSRELSR